MSTGRRRAWGTGISIAIVGLAAVATSLPLPICAEFAQVAQDALRKTIDAIAKAAKAAHVAHAAPPTVHAIRAATTRVASRAGDTIHTNTATTHTATAQAKKATK
jgi:hypothetical protein